MIIVMFAVPGWSVSFSALTTQTSEHSKSQPPKSSNSGSEVHTKIDKKRKRSSGKPRSSKVNSANLSDLWETVIEKKNETKIPSKENKPVKKRPRIAEELDDGNSHISNSISTNENAIVNLKETPEKLKNGSRFRIASKDVARGGTKHVELPPELGPTASLTPLQLSMRHKLISARFRHLNQTLYTTLSTESLKLFRQNPEMFQEYHEGFRKQVEVWPENPSDGYLVQIKRRAMERRAESSKMKASAVGAEGNCGSEILPLPRTNGTCCIADLGCGDAGLSQGLEGVKKKLRLQVHSYDLQSPNPLVTQADIADLPLKDGSVDIAIFCLALMGTNWIDFIEEAFRILRWKGELWIAEIKSRFGRVRGEARRVDYSVGNRKRSREETARPLPNDANVADLLIDGENQEDNKKDTDVSAFVEVLHKRGFILQNGRAVDLSNKMFVKMNFVKGQTPVRGKCVPRFKGAIDTQKKTLRGRFLDIGETNVSNEAAVLKPCVYKLR